MRLVVLCQKLQEFQEAAPLSMLAWDFLLRVQSGAVDLQAGALHELYDLPPGRHSAVVIHAHNAVHIRFRRRKKMPNGSLMSRPCTCHGSDAEMWCTSHMLKCRLQALQVGQRLFHQTSLQFLKLFHRALALLSIPHADQFGFKAFRAGRATQLARDGKPVHVIMQLGQWKSAAILNYVSPDALDAGIFWHQIVDGDSD